MNGDGAIPVGKSGDTDTPKHADRTDAAEMTPPGAGISREASLIANNGRRTS
jgi:hypothetical protein